MHRSTQRFAVILAALSIVTLVSAQNVSFRGAPSSPILVGAHPAYVAVGDFNRDGKLDLAVANATDNNITILLGNGDGTFSAANNSPFATGGNLTTAVVAADFNGDGILDLAVCDIPGGLSGIFGGISGNVGANLSVLIGNGDGTFQGHNDFGTGGDFPSSVAWGDFNGDGVLDAAVTNLNSNNVSILLGKIGSGGSFSFNGPAKITVGGAPSSVVVGDFNGDKKLDLAVANLDDGTVTILLGNGDGTFTPAANSPVAVGARPVALAVADFNGDGNADLAVANSLNSTVSILFGDGTGSFPTGKLFAAGRDPSAVAVGDFNNDGKPDLVVVHRYSGGVAVLLGNGDGTFANARNFPMGSNPLSVAVGDFNGDKQIDLAVANVADRTVSIALNSTDIIPPTTVATLSPTANANGWNNTPVTVTLTATDNPGGSGVSAIYYTIGTNPQMTVSSGSAVLNFTTEGILSITYYAMDNAGNVEKAHILTISIDMTPPVINSSQLPPANSAGWNNSNVTVSFTCSDALSGVASCNAPIIVSAEGANQIITGSATDLAGNSATTTRTISLDKTPPVLTMPTLAASYLYNSSLTLTFGATDALSGVASTQATLNGNPVSSGTTVTLNHLATNTFTLTSTDVAGNTATQTSTFAVVYNFIGFLAPIPNDNSGVFKLGSTVPVKFQLTDAKGAFVSTAVAGLTLQSFSVGTPIGTPIDATASGNADVGNLFRYDSTAKQYIYNLTTKPLSIGTWQIQGHLDDGTVHTVLIGTK